MGSQNAESNALVEGMILCFSTWPHVLFDPGATHSFISTSFASMLDIEYVPLLHYVLRLLWVVRWKPSECVMLMCFILEILKSQ